MQNKVIKDNNTISDEKLIEKIKKGDDAVFQELMRRYTDNVFSFVRRYANNDADAEDIAQDTFFKVWKNINRFKIGKSFKPWLFTIARNTALDHIKKNKAVVFSELDEPSDGMIFADFIKDEEPLQDQLFQHTQSANFLNLIRSELHPDYQTILTMRYNEELTFEEIAEMMNKPKNTIRSWHYRALKILRDILLHQKDALARIDT
ncbi:MAG: RNA polymerase sigma factor [Bacteroidota bacterium]